MSVAQHGGYRRPNNPAPASGPGALSRRTDGGPAQTKSAPTGLPYGEHKALMQTEAIAPMAGTPNIPNLNMPDSGQQQMPSFADGNPAMANVVPIGAPSQRPSEPITSGVNIGAGPNELSLPMEHQTNGAAYQQGPMTQMLSRLSARDVTGSLSTLLDYARAQGA